MRILSSNKRRRSLRVRQWVLFVSKRLRYFMQRDIEVLGTVLHILLHGIELNLRAMVDINFPDQMADRIVKAVLS